jgi:hypothetical protein
MHLLGIRGYCTVVPALYLKVKDLLESWFIHLVPMGMWKNYLTSLTVMVAIASSMVQFLPLRYA